MKKSNKYSPPRSLSKLEKLHVEAKRKSLLQQAGEAFARIARAGAGIVPALWHMPITGINRNPNYRAMRPNNEDFYLGDNYPVGHAIANGCLKICTLAGAIGFGLSGGNPVVGLFCFSLAAVLCSVFGSPLYGAIITNYESKREQIPPKERSQYRLRLSSIFD